MPAVCRLLGQSTAHGFLQRPRRGQSRRDRRGLAAAAAAGGGRGGALAGGAGARNHRGPARQQHRARARSGSGRDGTGRDAARPCAARGAARGARPVRALRQRIPQPLVTDCHRSAGTGEVGVNAAFCKLWRLMKCTAIPSAHPQLDLQQIGAYLNYFFFYSRAPVQELSFPNVPPGRAVMCYMNSTSLKAGKWFAEFLNTISVIKSHSAFALYHLHLVRQLNFQVLGAQ